MLQTTIILAASFFPSASLLSFHNYASKFAGDLKTNRRKRKTISTWTIDFVTTIKATIFSSMCVFCIIPSRFYNRARAHHNATARHFTLKITKDLMNLCCLHKSSFTLLRHLWLQSKLISRSTRFWFSVSMNHHEIALYILFQLSEEFCTHSVYIMSKQSQLVAFYANILVKIYAHSFVCVCLC